MRNPFRDGDMENEGTVAPLRVETQLRRPVPSSRDRDPRRRLPDVEVRAGRGASYRAPRGDEGDPGRAQVFPQRPPLRAVRMHGDVERVLVVKAHPVVQRRLAVRAHGERPGEAGREEMLEPEGI